MKMIIVKDAGGPGHTMELWAGVSQQCLRRTLSVNIASVLIIMKINIMRGSDKAKETMFRKKIYLLGEFSFV